MIPNYLLKDFFASLMESNYKTTDQVIENRQIDSRLQNLLTDQIRAMDALSENKDPLWIAYTFYVWGNSQAEYKHPEAEELIEYIKAKKEKYERERPIIIRNLQLEFLKELAQTKASSLWTDDKEKKIRLADMCEKIYRILKQLDPNKFKHVPGDAASLKPWLREVAPEYAKKPGRPVKKIKK